MNKRPYIICHMLMSIDGKVTGDFLLDKNTSNSCEIYYELHRNFKADGFICGRVTMEESFTKKHFPDLSKYENKEISYEDYIYKNDAKFYAIAFDRKGKLGWQNNIINDEDPGYDKSYIIEVLTKQVSKEYLCYLKEKNISYIFAGNDDLDVKLALEKIHKYFNTKTLLLEGGSIINGAFFKENLVDELSLVLCPLTANNNDKSLFYDTHIESFELIDVKKTNNTITLGYKKMLRINLAFFVDYYCLSLL